MSQHTPIAIAGCTGLMGRRLCKLSLKLPVEIVAAFTSAKNSLLGKPLSVIDPSLSSDVIISLPSLNTLSILPKVILDFSSPEATIELAKQASEKNVALLVGTTGLSSEQQETLYSLPLCLMHSMNYSLGLNLLKCLVKTTAEKLGNSFNVEIVETHHNKKLDAPSGSAIALAESICEGSDKSMTDVVYGRHGKVKKRSANEIGIHSIRLGSVVGDHTVMFGSEHEELHLSHHAKTRDVFAQGALRAAIWLAEQQKYRRYSMQEFLFCT